MSDKPGFTERALVFDCEGEDLLGIVSGPANGVRSSGIGIVIVVGGPQYRAGSHRQFTQLARAMAAEGHHCLRFDFRGMGDSSGARRDFMSVEKDIAAAIQALHAAQPDLSRVILWGLCDAASATLLYLQARPSSGDVHGLVLLNPWVRSQQSFAATQVKHYYLQRLGQRAFWGKLLRGGISLGALAGLGRALKTASRQPMVTGPAHHPAFQDRMLAGWTQADLPTLLILSEGDLTAQEFVQYCRTRPAWLRQLNSPSVSVVEIAGADHTFSSSKAKQAAEIACSRWMQEFAGSRANANI